VGEKQNQPCQVSRKASLKVDFRESRVTSDSGVVRRGDFEMWRSVCCGVTFMRPLNVRPEFTSQNAKRNLP
jgi:hypothetical protein